MFSLQRRIVLFLNKWPGKHIFGIWRFMPLFFVTGASLEFAMIHWHVGEVNFYKSYKRRVIQQEVERRLLEKEMESESQ